MKEHDQNDKAMCLSGSKFCCAHIGTIEPKFGPFEDWNADEMVDKLAFIYGAFEKYSDDMKDDYFDMNQDLCNYVRKLLDIKPARFVYIVEVYSNQMMQINQLVEEVPFDSEEDANAYIDNRTCEEYEDGIFHYYRIKKLKYVK